MIPFPMFDGFFFIFLEVDVHEDTTSLCKLQKNWTENVDLIA